MRKRIAFFLCLIVTILLFSCVTANENKDTDTDTDKDTDTDTVNTEAVEKDDGTTDKPAADSNKLYYKIDKIELTRVRYYIYDSNGNIVLSDETDRPLDISMLGDNIVDICIGMGTGVNIHKYYDVENNRFSDEYSYVVASSGNLVAYIGTSTVDPMANRVLVIRDIFEKNRFYKSFELDFSPTAQDPIESATFTDGEAELKVVYLSEGSPASLSVTLPVRRAATEGEISSQNEIVMQMYESAINDEICVFDERLGEIKLKACRFPSNNKRIDECKLLKKAILDVDQDGISEYVIQSPDNDHIILRYYNAKVYSYCLDSCDYYNFNTDGTVYWCNFLESAGRECGLKKIIFDRETINIKSIYSLKYSENSTKYEYFVEGKAVTGDEYYDYRNDYREQNRRCEEMKFSQFELTCSYPITAEQAWNLANAYWDHQDGRSECSAGTIWTARIVLIDTPNAETDYYRVAFQVAWNSGGGLEGYECMPPYSIEEHDQILVNAFTGEITTPAYELGGKCISIEEAIEIAKNYCGKSYYAEYDAKEAAPDHIYVIVFYNDVNRNDFHTRVWVDKYTGEIVFGYYLHGK